MSYGFKVTCSAGQLSVTSDGPQYVPDGTWSISGHSDETSQSLAAYQLDTTGRTVVGATASAMAQARKSPAAEQAPADSGAAPAAPTEGSQ